MKRKTSIPASWRGRLPVLLATLLALPLSSPVASGLPRPQKKQEQAGVPLPEGRTLPIYGDTRIAPGAYLRPPVSGPGASDGRAGVIQVEDVVGATLDLRGVELRGTPAGTDLDQNTGWGLVLRNCRDVTVLGGSFGGYKGCIVAENCSGLVIDGARFDGYYGQELLSTEAAENSADWLWPHANDEGEWIANYGAAISLTDCRDATVRNCKARHGQNGLLLTRCEDSRAYDNDFSFLSGWGIALYRSSSNVIASNVTDYCVRGYSHGVYWRGQDSAGILMFERCSDNVVAYNSATHSGDGLFLFGGRDAVEGRAFERGETEVGGSDRNLFLRNDFSYAVANSIETTFSSDNLALENRCDGSHQHGLWGGYSSRMVIADNTFRDTLGGGVTIEHGQECVLARNLFERNEIGVELYWDEDPQFVDGEYGKRFDTDSRDHWVFGNSFQGNDADLMIQRSDRLRLVDNVFPGEGQDLYATGISYAPGTEPAVPEGEVPPDARLLLRGLGGWWPTGNVSQTSLVPIGLGEVERLVERLLLDEPELPGKRQAWDPAAPDTAGLETIVMGRWGPWDFRSGEPRPEARQPGGVIAGAVWEATWFRWSQTTDPRGKTGELEAWRALEQTPLARAQVPAWVGPWGGLPEVRERVGNDRFGLIARTRVALEAGRYLFSITSDDGVRLSIDGQTHIENWTWHAATKDQAEVELTAGTHELVLEYFQIDGGVALTLDVELAENP